MNGGPWPADADEVARLREAEKARVPLLLLREASGAHVTVPLADERVRLSVGRADGNDLVLAGDPAVSRVHATLERAGGEWVVVDAGLSRNGTWVGDERVAGRRALRHGEAIRLGRTTLIFWHPSSAAGEMTAADAGALPPPRLSPAQREVLVALCRPSLGPGLASPASNEEIAAALFLTPAAVKSHLRVLYRKFGVAEMPQVRKRLALVARAVETGVVERSDAP